MSYFVNWLPFQVPQSGDRLVFSWVLNGLKNPYNDFTNYTFSKITFADDAKATTLSGNSIKLSGDIVNSSTENLQTIDLGINLLKNVNVNSGSGSHNLKIGGAISGGYGISKNGTSTLTLGGANTYTGATTITQGTLTLNSTGTIASSAGVSNAGTFIIQGNKTIGYLTGAGSTTLGANTLTITGTGTYSGVVDGTGGLVMNGVEKILTLSGVNTYSGGTVITAGIVNAITSAEALGTGPVSVASGAALQITGDLDFDEALTLSGTGVSSGGALRHISGNMTYSGGITLGADSRINSDADTLTLSGAAISGAAGLSIGGAGNITITKDITTGDNTLTKDGTGTLTLSGANTYTGATTVTEGVLKLDFSAAGAPASDIIDSGSALTLSGGSLILIGKDSATNSQTVNGLTLNAGHSEITLTATGGSNPIVLNLGDIVNNANATVNFTLPTGDQDITNGITTTRANDASGILGAWATVTTATGTEWAVKDALGTAQGNIRAMTDVEYLNIPVYGGIIRYDAEKSNVRIEDGGVSGDIVLEDEDTTINTLMQDSTVVGTVDMAGGTLRTYGIMVSLNAESLIIGKVGTAGTLTTASAGGSLVLSAQDPSSVLTVNSVIADNTLASSLIKSGDGTVVLNGVNTYTGATMVAEGTLELNNSLTESSGLSFNGTGAAVTLADGKNIGRTGNVINITTSDNSQGTLTLLGSGTIYGQVGASNLSLASVALSGGEGKTVNFNGDIYATTLSFSSDGTAIIASGKSITGDVDNLSSTANLGTLTLSGGNQAVSGNIGATDALKEVIVDSGTATFGGNIASETLTVTSNGTAIIASGKNVTADVNSFHGQGTLTLAGGDQVITGDVGTASQSWLGTVNIGGSGTATFNGAVKTKYFNVTDDREIVFNDSVTTLNDFTLSADSTVTLADGKDMTLGSGGMTSQSGQGTLTLSGDHTITGNIGSTLVGNNGLKLITVGNGAVSINGDVRALAVNFAGDNELTIGSGYGITGSVTTALNNTGTLTFAGATSTGGTIGALGQALKILNFNGATTLSNDIYAANTYIKSGSTVAMAMDTAITGNLTLNNASDAVLDLGLNTLTLAGNYTQSDDSRLKISLSDADWGRVDATGSPNISALSTLDVDVTGLLTHGAAFTVIDCASFGSIGELNIVWDSPLFNIRRTTSNEDLIIHVTRFKTYAEMGLNPNAVAVGQALDSILSSATGDMRTILGSLDAMESQQQISAALDSMEPVTDGAQTAISNNVMNKFVGTTILRLQDSKIEEGKAEKVVELNPQNDIWAQFYGDYAHQGKRGLSNGYRARMWGTVVGIDRLFREGALRLGFAQGFGFSKIRSKDNYGRTGIDSYQTGFYGEYQAKDSPFILDAVLTYGYNQYDSSRHVAVGGLNRTAQSDYDGQQFSSYLEAGYKIEKNGFDIIPLLALNYTHLYLSSYAETGADSLNLSVNSQQYDSLEPGVGLRLSKAFENKTGIITPEIRFRYFYDTINDKQQTIATFAGGGTSFETTGYKPDPSIFDFGARIEFFNKKNITLLADCNTVFKDDYYEAGGSLTVKYSF